MKFKISSLALAAALTIATGAKADILADHVNDSFSADDGAYWGVNDAGWLYTPSMSYNLIGINTEFSLPNLTSIQNRTVTVAIFLNNTPNNGGTLLGSFQFDSALAQGTLGGGTFTSAIPLTAGQQYFVGFENVGPFSPIPNVDDLGVNFTAAPGGTFLSNLYFDSSTCGTALSFSCEDTNTDVLGQPILQFFAPNPVTTSTPDPASLLLLSSGLAGLFVRRKLQRER